jgi:hypothetical protein
MTLPLAGGDQKVDRGQSIVIYQSIAVSCLVDRDLPVDRGRFFQNCLLKFN